MQTTNVNRYRQNLAALHRAVLQNHDPLVVTGPRGGDIVVLAKSDFDSLEESLKISMDKITLESIKEARMRMDGELPPFKSMDEVFQDVLES